LKIEEENVLKMAFKHIKLSHSVKEKEELNRN